MVRYALLISLLFLVCLEARADMLRYRGSDGRLYFTNTPTVRHQKRPTPVSTRGLIRELARRYHIEPRLVRAIIRVESNFNPRAVSRTGAQGLMQLMPATLKRYQVMDAFDPRANIEAGLRYLHDLIRQFPGDLRRVLAAYNAGEQAVYRYGGIPPFPETQRYVERVMRLYGTPDATRKIYRYRTPNGSILYTNIPR